MKWSANAVLFFAALLTCRASETLPPNAAACVNGRIISARLLDTLAANDQSELRADPRTPSGKVKLQHIRASVLDELIDRALIFQETEKRGVSPSSSEVEEAEKKIVSTFGGENQYRDFLAQNSLSRDEYRNEVVRAGLCRENLARALGNEHPISTEDVAAYYGAHLNEAAFQLPERVSVAHININMRRDVLTARLQHADMTLKGDALEKAITNEIERRRKLMGDIRRQILHGADFAELARKYSDDPGTKNQGGVLDPFPRRAHPREFEETAFGLKKPGELSEAVEDFYGLHLIKLIEHLPAHAVTLEEATPEIRRRLEQEQQATRFAAWLKKARAEATVTLANNETMANAVTRSVAK